MGHYVRIFLLLEMHCHLKLGDGGEFGEWVSAREHPGQLATKNIINNHKY